MFDSIFASSKTLVASVFVHSLNGWLVLLTQAFNWSIEISILVLSSESLHVCLIFLSSLVCRRGSVEVVIWTLFCSLFFFLFHVFLFCIGKMKVRTKINVHKLFALSFILHMKIWDSRDLPKFQSFDHWSLGYRVKIRCSTWKSDTCFTCL